MSAPWFYSTSPEWVDMPRDYRDFYGDRDCTRAFRLWLNEDVPRKRRVDQIISRMIGRHPDDVDHGNYAIWFQIWDERFRLMAVEMNSRRAFLRPETPEIEDRRAG